MDLVPGYEGWQGWLVIIFQAVMILGSGFNRRSMLDSILMVMAVATIFACINYLLYNFFYGLPVWHRIVAGVVTIAIVFPLIAVNESLHRNRMNTVERR